MDANIRTLINLLTKAGSPRNPKDLVDLSGLSIDAVRRALKRAVQEGSILKRFKGPFTYYHVAPPVTRSRVRKGRSVYDWHVGGQRLPKARGERLVALRQAGVAESIISKVVD